MTLGEAVILGVVQGLSEFLPISSSGHLVLVEHWLGISSADLVFEVAVHAGTLLSVLWFFRTRLVEFALAVIGKGTTVESVSHSRRQILYLIIGTIPATVIGLSFKDRIEQVFADSHIAAVFLMVTGVILLSTYLRKQLTREITSFNAFLIGCAQAVSILPGISRSGSTISAGLWCGIKPAMAAEFSFLLSIPAVGGAILLTMPDAWGTGRLGLPHLVGAIVAAATGYVALKLVFAFLRGGRFALFGVYCLIVGALATFLLK